MTEPGSPLTVRHSYSSSPERVFDAWIDPAVTRRWLFATPDGEIVRCDLDPRPGGALVITDRRGGDDVEHRGAFVEIERPHRLVFTFGVPKYSSLETTVRLHFAPAGSGCDLTLVHEGVPPEWATSTEQGWRDLFASLDRLLQG